jgi:hypothetical protein
VNQVAFIALGLENRTEVRVTWKGEPLPGTFRPTPATTPGGYFPPPAGMLGTSGIPACMMPDWLDSPAMGLKPACCSGSSGTLLDMMARAVAASRGGCCAV